jgi:choline dehydrogenase-like flavoprotein
MALVARVLHKADAERISRVEIWRIRNAELLQGLYVSPAQRTTMKVSHLGHFSPLSRAYVKTLQQLGIPYTPDFNTASTTAWVTIVRRSSCRNGLMNASTTLQRCRV